MSVNLVVAQVAPMEHIARVVRQEMDSGPANQLAVQSGVAEALSKAGEQVEKTSPGEAGQKVSRRSDGRGGKKGQTPEHFLNGEENPGQSPEDFLAQSPENGAADAWTGNIVNVKV
jgi:hypothetical protein